ncbi:hypothetical protein ACGFYU_10900 [Streptomyces sp. NPDC048337]|uniref:hypothetical protein n=1 Tax=Streptomyces sp. NPDC048337 TaxID=3365535 RepID=UPI0037178FFD
MPDPTACLRCHLGREDVEVAREGTVSHFDQLPLSLLTTATLDWVRAAVPPCRAWPFVEDDWFGGVARAVRAGSGSGTRYA